MLFRSPKPTCILYFASSFFNEKCARSRKKRMIELEIGQADAATSNLAAKTYHARLKLIILTRLSAAAPVHISSSSQHYYRVFQLLSASRSVYELTGTLPYPIEEAKIFIGFFPPLSRPNFLRYIYKIKSQTQFYIELTSTSSYSLENYKYRPTHIQRRTQGPATLGTGPGSCAVAA